MEFKFWLRLLLIVGVFGLCFLFRKKDEQE